MEPIPQVYSLFQQPWWLEAVAPGRWAEVQVKRGGETVARLPYFQRRSRLGLTVLTQPPLTLTLGPWLRPSTAKYANRLKEQKSLMTELIEGLPPHDRFIQNFSPDLMNWMPFHWAGFKSELKYTYRLEDLTNLAAIWEGFCENVRRNIRKSEKTVQVRESTDVEILIDLLKCTFERQELGFLYDEEAIRKVHAESLRRKCGKTFLALDDSGKIHAALFMVWDLNCAYYLLGGGHPTLRNSGAASLLLWEAIQFSAKVTRLFDFGGAMIEPIERFFSSFGARQVPYLAIRKSSPRARFLESADAVSKNVFTLLR